MEKSENSTTKTMGNLIITMSSMNLERHMEEQELTEEKPIIENCQKPSENVAKNAANLAKSEEEVDKEFGISTTTNTMDLPHHRKLAAELNREIFYCLNLGTRRKFISGLGWGFYAMFRQILLIKSKRLRNPQGNAWGRSTAGITISNGGLNARMNTNLLQTVYAEKGFPVFGQNSREDNFPGTILYYYEVNISKPAFWCFVGLTDGKILPGGWTGRSPNSYAILLPPIPNFHFYDFFLVGQRHDFEFPDGVIRPEVKKTGNVTGCGILMNSDDKMTIFFTFNGILIDRQFQIDPKVDHLVPTVSLFGDMSVEANFGENPAKPFEYHIKKCPGMGLEWV